METQPLNFDKYPQKPHGGTLINQVVPEHLRAAEIERARGLPSIRVDLEAISWCGRGVISSLE